MHELARRLAIAFAAAAMLCLPKRAEARPEARLVYVRAPSAATCPDEQGLVGAVAERLGYVPFSPGASRVVMVEVEHASNRWRGTVEAIDDAEVHGRRELFSDGASCSELAASLALSVALLLDPDRAMGFTSAPAVEPAVVPPAVDPHDDPFAEKSAAAPSSTTPGSIKHGLAWTVGGLGGASLGSEPSPVPAGGAFVEAQGASRGSGQREGGPRERSAFRVGLDVRAHLSSATPDNGGVSVRVWLAQGTLVPCYAPGLVAVCGLASVGVITGVAQGDAARGRRTASLYSASGRASRQRCRSICEVDPRFRTSA